MNNMPTRNGVRFAVRPTVLLTLTCGCKLKVRSIPRPHAYMSCMSGLSHGSRLHWTQAVEGDRVQVNDRVESR